MANNKRLLTIPPEQWAMVQYEAEKQKWSQAGMVREAIKFYFNQNYRPSEIPLLETYKPNSIKAFPAKRNEVEEFEP